MRQMYYKAHDMLRKARKHKSGGNKTILERWHDDDKYRKSLSDIGWNEERIIQCDEITLEDHSYVATWQERSRNAISWNISLPKDCMTNIQKSLETETNQSLLHNKSGTGLINNLKASKNTITDLNLVQDGDPTLLPGRRIHPRHRTGSRTATGSQIDAGICGKHHPGLNSNFFFFVQRCHFACRKFNLLAIEGVW